MPRKYCSIGFVTVWLVLLVHAEGLSQSLDYIYPTITYNWDGVMESKDQLSGTMEISYTQMAECPLDTIFLHLWANAFGNRNSAYHQQALANGQRAAHYAFSPEVGYRFQEVLLNEQKTDLQYDPNHTDIAFLVLPQPAMAFQTTKISLKYTLKIPKLISRFGYTEDEVHLAHWYPRLAVQDCQKAYTLPYLSAGEFFGPFATYHVRLQFPVEYNAICPFELLQNQTDTTKTVLNVAYNAHDVAIFLSKKYQKQSRQINIDGRDIIVEVVCRDTTSHWSQALSYLERALRFYSEHIGTYPYPKAIIVEDRSNIRGGMEYPAIATVSAEDKYTLDYYIAHEVGHWWFQSIFGFDERRYPWLDEGLTTYYEHRYTDTYYGDAHYDMFQGRKWLPKHHHIIPAMYQQTIKSGRDRPIDTPVEELDMIQYGFNAYERAGTMFSHIAAYIGQSNFDKAMQQMFEIYAYRHPTPDMVKTSLEQQGGKELDQFFEGYISGSGQIDYTIQPRTSDKDIEVVQIGSKRAPMPVIVQSGEFTDTLWTKGNQEVEILNWHSKIEQIIIDPEGLTLDFNRANNALKGPLGLKPFFGLDQGPGRYAYFLPVVSVNAQDGIGAGMAFFNSTIPSQSLQYVIWPQYSFGSKSLTGHSTIRYWSTPTDDANVKRWSIATGVKRFHYLNNGDVKEDYIRLDPSLRIELSREVDHQSWIEAKYIRLWEKDLGLDQQPQYRDSHIRRLSWNKNRSKTLSQSALRMELEQANYTSSFFVPEHYLKATLVYSAAWFYNPTAKVSLRWFASGFLSNSARDNSSSIAYKGVIALSPQGYNDYAYDSYFLARADQSSAFNRQFDMVRGGGFRHSHGLAFSTSTGQSQDYATSLQVTIDAPSKWSFIQPQLTLDVGYFNARVSPQDGTRNPQSLYSLGISLDIMDGLAEIHIPLLYSDLWRQQYASEGRNVFSRISFGFNLHKYNPWQRLEEF